MFYNVAVAVLCGCCGALIHIIMLPVIGNCFVLWLVHVVVLSVIDAMFVVDAVMLSPVHVNASSVNASHAVVSWTFDSMTSDHIDTFLVFTVSLMSSWQSVSYGTVFFIGLWSRLYGKSWLSSVYCHIAVAGQRPPPARGLPA